MESISIDSAKPGNADQPAHSALEFLVSIANFHFVPLVDDGVEWLDGHSTLVENIAPHMLGALHQFMTELFRLGKAIKDKTALCFACSPRRPFRIESDRCPYVLEKYGELLSVKQVHPVRWNPPGIVNNYALHSWF